MTNCLTLFKELMIFGLYFSIRAFVDALRLSPKSATDCFTLAQTSLIAYADALSMTT